MMYKIQYIKVNTTAMQRESLSRFVWFMDFYMGLCHKWSISDRIQHMFSATNIFFGEEKMCEYYLICKFIFLRVHKTIPKSLVNHKNKQKVQTANIEYFFP